MSTFIRFGLLTKVVLTIAVIMLIFFSLSSYLTYRQQRAYIIEDAAEKARVIASEAIRAREYLSSQLQAGDVELSVERYGLIPVVASTRIGALVAEDLDYEIRQISKRYRNPKNAPDPFESRVLDRFQENPYQEEHHGITEINGEPVFRYLQSFTVEESCLECHGDPERAPDYIKKLFPEESDQAYYYKIGEVIGAASVTIPMARLQAQLWSNVRSELIATGGIFLALVLSLGILVRVAVTRPISRLAEALSNIVRTGRFEEKLEMRSKDEIGVLTGAFNEMIDRLKDQTEHLEESERRFRTLTETARDGIVSFLAGGQIILFNQAAQRLFGYSKAEILGENVEKLIHPESRSVHDQGIADYLRDNAPELMRHVQTIKACRRDGTLLLLELSLSVADSDGHKFYTAIVREADEKESGTG
ncbi:MAG: DUF3365 domain-containing protein [Desulfuromonadales bacterium]